MTHTDDIKRAETAAVGAQWDQCDSCQAPMDERQRYCVACGSRRMQADDPVARYFVSAARSARAAAQPAPASSQSRSRFGLQSALVLALLPLVAGVGILIGRSADNGDELAAALKAQKAPIVNVGGSTGAGAVAKGSGGTSKAAKGSSDAANGKVISKTRYGTARQLTDAKTTPEQLEKSKQAIDKIVKSKGKAYVEQQRGLPDQIVIP